MTLRCLSAALLLLIFANHCWAIDSPPLSSKANIPYPAILRVYFDQPEHIQSVVDQMDVWTINPKQQFAVVQINQEDDFKTLQKLSLTLRLDQQLMDRYANHVRQISRPHKAGSGIPGFSCYSTVAETFQRMDQMAANFPDLAETVDIGDSWEKIQNGASGEDLRVIKLTKQNSKTNKPILFMASSIHAREYATAELNTRFAEFMLNNYGTHADVTWILDNHEIHLSLVTNPDGRKRAQTGLLWRKNTNNNHCPDSNNRGVDLNRNYPFEWAIGGSSSACSEVFYGPSESSEPEITAQMDYLRSVYADNRGTGANDAAPDDTTGIFVDIHSFSQLVLWPWGYTNNVTPNDNQLQALGKRTALFNQYRPQPVNDLVITGGGSIDAVYGELGVASLAFELGTSFFQDCASFENQILPDNLNALLYLARVTQAPYTQPLGPDIEDLSITPNVITAATQVRISGVADDNRYNQSNGAQNTGLINGVSAYINELPSNTASSLNLAATDGDYDAITEAFGGYINTESLMPGSNTLFVQAHDGFYAGGTFAQFVDVVEASQVATLSGQVSDALTGLPINRARLSVNGSAAETAPNGHFLQYVQPATADLHISADQYASLTLHDLSLLAGQSVQQDIQLQPFCEIFSDAVETGNQQWQADSPWGISSELSNSPLHAWSDSPAGNYAPNVNTALTSPAINVIGTNSVAINYNSFCDTEAGFDFGFFEVQFDGGVWQTISQCDGQNNWQAESQVIDIPDNTSQLMFRFRLNSDGFIETDGWHIDDISVKASGPLCSQFINDIIFIDDFE